MLAENLASEQAPYPLHFPLIGHGWFSTYPNMHMSCTAQLTARRLTFTMRAECHPPRKGPSKDRASTSMPGFKEWSLTTCVAENQYITAPWQDAVKYGKSTI